MNIFTYIVIDKKGRQILHCSSNVGPQSYQEARDLCALVGGKVLEVTWAIEEMRPIESHDGDPDFLRRHYQNMNRLSDSFLKTREGR